MTSCVCGHSHTDGCPCGCSYPELDTGTDISPATTTHRNGALDKYCGQYRGPYSLEETA